MPQIRPIRITATENLPRPSYEPAREEDLAELEQSTLQALEEIFDDQIWISWTRDRQREAD